MLHKRRLTPIVALIEAWGPLPDLGRWGQMNARGLLCVKMLLLEPFQTKFMAAATAPGTHLAALSLPRGTGKSRLAAHLVERILTPSDALFRPGTESVLCAASIEQARIVYRFARAELEGLGGYRFIDSATRAAILHKATNTRLRVIGSNGKTAMGLVGCPWAIADEPGSWETTGGQLLFDALETSKGKPGSPLRSLYIGTLAPSTSGWWHELSLGKSGKGRAIKCLQGDRAKWDDWREVRRVNPLTRISPEFRKQLRAELKAAIADSRLKARFLSYRLNLPSADEATMLLTVDDFEQMAGREVADRRGRPIVAIDLGGGRAWSAATAIWQSGRVEALAIAPGIPDISTQEDRDQVPRGTYGRLLQSGRLRMAHGLRVQPPAALMAAVKEEWGEPELIVCDRFRLGELKDCVNGTQVIPRVSRWSEAGDDIRSLRRLVKDGPWSVEETSRPLLAASLSVAMVKNDDAGNTRLTKKASNNTARDDVAAALVLGAGVFQRARAQPKRAGAYLGTA